MKISSFISKRIASKSSREISGPIVSIATWGIALGVCIMIISLSVVLGFQEAIKEKIIGFGGHFHLNAIEQGNSKGTSRLKRDDTLLKSLRSIPQVKHVQSYAASAGIIETHGALQGALIKGVDEQFESDFLKSHLITGSVINRFDLDTAQILLSSFMSERMSVGVGDKVSVYVFQEDEQPRQRNFTVCGIYTSGLEQMDQQLAFIALPQLVRMSGWDLRCEIFVDSLSPNQFVLEPRAYGGFGKKTLKWSDSISSEKDTMHITLHGDSTFTLIVSDESGSYPDTSWVQFSYNANSCAMKKGSSHSETLYTGGYEILINEFDDLWSVDDKIFELTTSSFLQTQRITDRIPEIFSWLEMLDINVIIIVVLMIVISIVNMTSAMLIIILERQNFVGILKTMGMTNSTIGNVFIQHSSRIILKGIIIGNLIGLSLVYLQHSTSVLSLDPEQYYLDHVPVIFSWLHMVILNVLTAIVCILSMIIPSLYVTRLRPTEALSFR